VPFQILGRVQTQEVRGGNKLVKVREFQVMSLPSETYFQFRRDATQPCYAAPKPCAAQFADRIEAVMGDDRVTDVVYSQDTSAGGRLQDMMTTYYSTPDGAVSGSVEQRLANFGPSATLALVAQEIAAGGDQLGS
jgi:hypothetical protein